MANALSRAMLKRPAKRNTPDGGGNPDIGNPGWAMPDADPNKQRHGKRPLEFTRRGKYRSYRNDGVGRWANPGRKDRRA